MVVLILFAASIMKTFQTKTEQEVSSAIAVCLKYAPDRCGGGRKKLCSCQKVLIHLESNITYLSYVYLVIVKYYICYEMFVMDSNIGYTTFCFEQYF